MIQNSSVTANLNGLAFIDANTGIIVGDGGTVLRTTDGGLAWVTLSTGTTAPLYGVAFVNSNIGTIVGDGG